MLTTRSRHTAVDGLKDGRAMLSAGSIGPPCRRAKRCFGLELPSIRKLTHHPPCDSPYNAGFAAASARRLGIDPATAWMLTSSGARVAGKSLREIVWFS